MAEPTMSREQLQATLMELRQHLIDAHQEIQNQADHIGALQQAAAAPAPQVQISRKMEPFHDPGSYKGERTRFQEWWTKMRAWLDAYATSFSGDRERCLAVWSRMEGPVAGTYAQTRIRHCTENQNWPDQGTLITEVSGFFSPQSEVDFARKRIQSLRQGGSRTEEFLNQFVSFKQSGEVSDDYAFALLLQATKPEIMRESLLKGVDHGDFDALLTAVRTTGIALEQHKMLYSQGRNWFNNTRASGS
jgi:hypothetical protein